MNTDRRTFLGAAVAAAVLPFGGRGAECGDARLTKASCRWKGFPILVLELCGKYKGEIGEIDVSHLTSRRLVTVDLEDEAEWGDINSFWDGENLSLGLGNDEDGYWKIVKTSTPWPLNCHTISSPP